MPQGFGFNFPVSSISVRYQVSGRKYSFHTLLPVKEQSQVHLILFERFGKELLRLWNGEAT